MHERQVLKPVAITGALPFTERRGERLKEVDMVDEIVHDDSAVRIDGVCLCDGAAEHN